MPSIRRISSSARLNAARSGAESSATMSQRPLVECTASTSGKPRRARITDEALRPSTASDITARTRLRSASGCSRTVKPRITPSVVSRSMRFCTVPRETLSVLARAAAGARPSALSAAMSRRSSSSIVGHLSKR